MSATAIESRREVNVLTMLAVIAAVASVVLTGAAFWLSYEHLHDVAAGHGLAHSSVRAWAWPATVDLFIVIGEVLILRASLRSAVDPWAIGLTVVGSSGSIALNVAGVGANGDPMDYVVAAVPPIAALLAFGALMRQLHGALAARVEALPQAPPLSEAASPQGAPEPAPGTPPMDAPERPEIFSESAPADAPKAPPATKRKRPESAPKAPREAPKKAPAKRPKGATRADAKAAIEVLYDTKKGRPLEGEMTAVLAKLHGYPHTSRQHANRLRAEIERERPDLAALGSDNVVAMTGS